MRKILLSVLVAASLFALPAFSQIVIRTTDLSLKAVLNRILDNGSSSDIQINLSCVGNGTSSVITKLNM